MNNSDSRQSLSILEEFRLPKEKAGLLINYYLRENMVESVEAFRALGLLQPDPGTVRTLKVGDIDFDKITEEAIKEFPPRVLEIIDQYNTKTRELAESHPSLGIYSFQAAYGEGLVIMMFLGYDVRDISEKNLRSIKETQLTIPGVYVAVREEIGARHEKFFAALSKSLGLDIQY